MKANFDLELQPKNNKTKPRADLHCQIYFLSTAAENTEKNLKEKFDLSDKKYNLKTKVQRRERDNEWRNYDPDCTCCQVCFH